MSVTLDVQEAKTEATDRAALLLMLSYVEAECRRIGATEAARHAAQAAALLPDVSAADIAAVRPAPPSGSRCLH